MLIIFWLIVNKGTMNNLIKLAQVFEEKLSKDNDINNSLNTYLSMLRALSILHQITHWTSNGVNFYQIHLLTDRLYNETLKHIDDVGEKITGLFGNNVITPTTHIQFVSDFVAKHQSKNKLQSLLNAEKEFLEFSKAFYQMLYGKDKLSLGFDDLISSIASDHESFTYLLQNSMKEDEIDEEDSEEVLTD